MDGEDKGWREGMEEGREREGMRGREGEGRGEREKVEGDGGREEEKIEEKREEGEAAVRDRHAGDMCSPSSRLRVNYLE